MITIEEEQALVQRILAQILLSSQSTFQLKEFGVSSADEWVVKKRLLADNIVKATGFGSALEITAEGLRIARVRGGYQGHLAQVAADTRRKELWSNWATWSTIVSAIAAVIGVPIAAYSAWQSSQETKELEPRIQRLEQVHRADSIQFRALQVQLTKYRAATISPNPIQQHNSASGQQTGENNATQQSQPKGH